MAAKSGKRVGKWVGGYVWKTAAGRPVYYLEHWWSGGRVHKSTGANTLAAAMKEWEKFQLDPIGYTPREQSMDAVLLTAELALQYRDHQLKEGLSKEWTQEVGRCLADWQVAFNGRDLRALNLHRDIKPKLNAWKTRRANRIKALKGLFRWLREELGLVDRNRDVTFDLKVPPSVADKRDKAVHVDHVQAVLKELPATTREIIFFLTGTGWHLSEVGRFHASGRIMEPPPDAPPEVLAVLVTIQKNGEETRTPLVKQEHLDSAKRIKAWKKFPTRNTVARHMREARKKTGVPFFGAGWMRHTVLNYGKKGGASMEQLAEFAEHKNKRTTEKHYVKNFVRNPIPVVLFDVP